jgi:trehalose 6-phosphate synthase
VLSGVAQEQRIFVTVVVVSNRVARTKPDEPMAGGLAAALLPAVKDYGAIWVGSSGRLRDVSQRDAFAEIEAFGKGATATIDLPQDRYCGYYNGFANSALWPALHSRADLIRAMPDDYASYREVNAYMARALIRFCAPDALFWIHDYHLLTLGLELRRLGVEQPIGFFLHTPWPERTTISAIPHHRELVQAMLACSLIGFQTDEDRRNFIAYVRGDHSRAVVHDRVISEYGACRLAVFPVGIDVEEFVRRGAVSAERPEVARLRSSLQGAKLVIGVDRVDYSKGLPYRIRAFDHMLTAQPALKGEVSYLQIAVPSRGDVAAYGELQSELATLVGEVNGRQGESDWTPIRYLNKAFSPAVLAGFYRAARVGLVTPLRDGMNLVAKEYVAAQNPLDPGVLILSQFAGAAKQLDGALIVNPHDIDDVAKKMAGALTMPGDERRQRWEPMMNQLRASSVQRWFSDFVEALAATRVLPALGVSTLPPRLAETAQSY